MQFFQIISVVTVSEAHLKSALKRAHQSIDSLVIEGTPVHDAQVRVKRVCDPKMLERLIKTLEE